jgi:SAM-dependent methyltransferase
MIDPHDLAWLTSDAGDRALADLAADPRPLHQRLSALRRALPTSRAALLCEQVALRAKAAAKFGPLAERMLFTPELLSEATDLWTAGYAAERFAEADLAVDFCCGIGGDLAALARLAEDGRIGCVVGRDRSPIACVLARFNAAALAPRSVGRLEVVLGEAADHDPPVGSRWRVDPERRAGGRRSTRPDQHSPPASLLQHWLRERPDGAVKLAPAAACGPPWPPTVQGEWISRGRECRQLLVSDGILRCGTASRRATRVVGQRDSAVWTACTFDGEPDLPADAAAAPLRYVFDPDPAVVAARLTGALARAAGLRTLGPGSVYLTGDALANAPLAAAFEVEAAIPLRSTAVRDWLRGQGRGRVEVKCRGVDVDPHRFAAEIRNDGEGEATVLLTRVGDRRTAIVARRLGPDEASPAAAPERLQ